MLRIESGFQLRLGEEPLSSVSPFRSPVAMALSRHLPVYARPLTACPHDIPPKRDSALVQIERAVLAHPKTQIGVHVTMVALYLALILVPPWLPPHHAWVGIAKFLIWCVWWPFVTLSTLGFGRLWCGVLCPEGALSAYASRLGGQRPIPEWMRWGGIPLLAS